MATAFKYHFDVLKVDGLDSDDDDKPRKAGKQKQSQQNGGGKQKQPQVPKAKGDNQKSKGAQQPKGNIQNKKGDQTNNNVQKQPGLKQQGQQPAKAKAKTKQKPVDSVYENKKWEEWVQMDEAAVGEAFQKDLHEALLMSKLEFEKAAKERPPVPPPTNHVSDQPTNESDEKKKKRNRKAKSKSTTLSLDEFNNPAKNDKPETNTTDPLPLRLLPEGESNPNFFNDIDADADKIVQLSKTHEEYQKQFAQESVRVQKLEEKVGRRDMEITMLRTSLQKKDDELQQVKKRNKQLCVILAQGEMKDKAEILIQSDNMSQVNYELTEQVSELTADLEKERSKVHNLESEIDKLKQTSGRHQSSK